MPRQYVFKQVQLIASHWARLENVSNIFIPIDLIKVIDSYTHRIYWCYNCFKSSKKCDLFYCKKCQIAKFCSKKCRREAKIHDNVCFDINSKETILAINAINTMSGKQCMDCLKNNSCFSGNCYSAILLKRLRSILYYRYQSQMESQCKKYHVSKIHDYPINPYVKYVFKDDDFGDIGFELHGIARFGGVRSKQAHAQIMQMAWAVPGMPELLLHDTLVREKYPMKPIQQSKSNTNDNSTCDDNKENMYSEDEDDSDDSDQLNIDNSDDNDGWGEDPYESCDEGDYKKAELSFEPGPTYEWCYFLMNFLRNTIMYDCLVPMWKFPCSSHWDGRSEMINIYDKRTNQLLPFGKLALFKFISLFCKTGTVDQCGDAFCWGTNTMSKYLTMYGNSQRIIEYLWKKNALENVILEFQWSNNIGHGDQTESNKRIVDNVSNILYYLVKDINIIKRSIKTVYFKALYILKIIRLFGDDYCWATEHDVQENCTLSVKHQRQKVFLDLNKILWLVLNLPDCISESNESNVVCVVLGVSFVFIVFYFTCLICFLLTLRIRLTLKNQCRYSIII